MNHYGYDMDFDNEITSKDSGIFHEMMDSEAQSDSNYGKSVLDILGECGLLALLVLVVPLVVLHIIGWLGSILN